MPSFVAQAASMESSKSRRWSVGAIHAANEPNVGAGCVLVLATDAVMAIRSDGGF